MNAISREIMVYVCPNNCPFTLKTAQALASHIKWAHPDRQVKKRRIDSSSDGISDDITQIEEFHTDFNVSEDSHTEISSEDENSSSASVESATDYDISSESEEEISTDNWCHEVNVNIPVSNEEHYKPQKQGI